MMLARYALRRSAELLELHARELARAHTSGGQWDPENPHDMQTWYDVQEMRGCARALRDLERSYADRPQENGQ